VAKSIRVRAVDRDEVPVLEMPERFRREVVYFMTPSDHEGAPLLGPNEYWVQPEHVVRWLEDGGFSVMSPLAAEAVAEIELSEDQERWLEWMQRYNVSRIRIES